MQRIRTLWSDLKESCDLSLAVGSALLFTSSFYFISVPGLAIAQAGSFEGLPGRQIALVVAALCSFLVGLPLRRHSNTPIPPSKIALPSGAICTLGCLLIVLHDAGFSLEIPWILILALVFLGIGIAQLLLAWSSYHATMTLRRRVAATASSAIIACIFSVLLNLLPLPFAFCCASLFPISSAVLLALEVPKHKEEESGSTQNIDLQQATPAFEVWFVKNRKLLVSTVIYGILFAFTDSVISWQANASEVIPRLLPLFILLITIALITWFMVKHSKREDANVAFRPGIILIAIGLLLLPFFRGTLLFLSLGLVNAGIYSFLIYFWIVLGNITQKFKSSSFRISAYGFLFFGLGAVVVKLIDAVGIFRSFQEQETLFAIALCGLFLLVYLLWLTSRGDILANEPDTAENAAELDLQSNNPEQSNPATVGNLHREKLLAQAGITHREEEIILLLLKGRSVPYICDELFIAKSTVQTHIKHIYSKLGISGKQQLIDMLEVTG